MDVELNEAAARAIGFYRDKSGGWRNSWGSEISRLLDFSGDPYHAQVIVRAFEPTFQTRMDGTYEAFKAEYREDMSPKEICFGGTVPVAGGA